MRGNLYVGFLVSNEIVMNFGAVIIHFSSLFSEAVFQVLVAFQFFYNF